MDKNIIYLGLIVLPTFTLASDTFDMTSGKLSMPSVIVGSDCYQVTMQHQGELVFNVTSAEGISATPINTSITIEPDDFSVDADITTLSSAALSIVGEENITSSIVAAEFAGQSVTGTQVFGYSNGNNIEARWYNSGIMLRIDFKSPTNFVSADIGANDSFDRGEMSIYNLTGELLETITSVQLDSSVNSDTLSTGVRTTADIAYALISGTEERDTVAIDNIQYHEVSVSCDN